MLVFDWEKYSKDDIDMEFLVVWKPKLSPITVEFGKIHTFPSYCSIEVGVKSSGPALPQATIERTLVQYPKEKQAVMRKQMEEWKLRTLDVVVTDLKSAKTHSFIVEDINLMNAPVDVSSGTLPYAIFMHKVGDSISIRIKDTR